MMYYNFNSFTVPDTFLPFGIKYGDTPVPRRDSDSNRILLSTDVWLFGYRQRSLYVSFNTTVNMHLQVS